MRAIYLALAILGTVIPYAFFLAHFGAEGTGVGTFIAAPLVNSVSRGFAADLVISSAAFWAWAIHARTPRPWLYILLNVAVGLSCALPAYLYGRERASASSGAAV